MFAYAYKSIMLTKAAFEVLLQFKITFFLFEYILKYNLILVWLLNIFVETRNFQWIESSKEQHLFETESVCIVTCLTS